MEWMATFVAGIVAVVLFAPLIMLLGTLFVLVPLAHLAPLPTTLARTSLDCPSAKRRVNVTFATPPGCDTPGDVVSCSLFTDERGIRCAKGCLHLARTRWTPSPMVPRYSLVADGVVARSAT